MNLGISSTLRSKSAQLLENKTQSGKTLFSIGVGINQTNGVPLRFLSYLLPITSAVYQCRDSIGQVYLADQGAIRLGQDPATVLNNADKIENLIMGFIEEFCPNLKARLKCSREKNGDSDETIQLRSNLLTEMVNKLKELSDPSIIKFAENRCKGGDINTSLQYMAEHTLYMRDPITSDPRMFLIENPEGFDTNRIAMIGGPAEEIFFKVRQCLLKALDSSDKEENLQLFTDIGRIPPYYSRFDEKLVGEVIEDLSAKEFLEKLSDQLRYDYLMLLIACSGSSNSNLVKRRNSGFSNEDYEILQNGFDRLKYFLNQF